MDLSVFFQYGVPTALLVGLCYGIYLFGRKVASWVERGWEYLTGSGEIGSDGKKERLGIVTELKTKHFEFMDRTAVTHECMSYQLESHQDHFKSIHDKLDKILESRKSGTHGAVSE